VTDSFGKTLLMCACYKNKKDIVVYLIQHPELDINQTDHLFWSALTYACNRKNTELVAILLSHPQIDPNSHYSYQAPALIKVIEKDYNDIAQLLIKHPKIDPNVQDDNGMTALMWACYRGNIFLVRKLLFHKKIDPFHISSDHKTAYDFAPNYHIRELLKPFFSGKKEIKNPIRIYSSPSSFLKNIFKDSYVKKKLYRLLNFVKTNHPDLSLLRDSWKEKYKNLKHKLFLQKPIFSWIELNPLRIKQT
jgi:ankyrin repeat protein